VLNCYTMNEWTDNDSLTFFIHSQGNRFGGALDAAARQFSEAFDAGQHPMEFVNSMHAKRKLIMGIGHRVKSLNNPDTRVSILKVNRSANMDDPVRLLRAKIRR
jgi:citrate synthase